MRGDVREIFGHLEIFVATTSVVAGMSTSSVMGSGRIRIPAPTWHPSAITHPPVLVRVVRAVLVMVVVRVVEEVGMI